MPLKWECFGRFFLAFETLGDDFPNPYCDFWGFESEDKSRGQCLKSLEKQLSRKKAKTQTKKVDEGKMDNENTFGY